MDSTAKIQAIKLIREKTEMGLHAAKLAIEAYIAEHPRANFGEIVDAVVNANPRGTAPASNAELAADAARLRAALDAAATLAGVADEIRIDWRYGLHDDEAQAKLTAALAAFDAARAATTPQFGGGPGAGETKENDDGRNSTT